MKRGADVPQITVLMPSFNAGRFFDAAVRSIVSQAFRDWELLVVDDASTDGTDAAAEAWAAKDPRVRVIRNAANKGQTACLNQGLREARGEWVARQDADDLSHPLRLSRQFEAVTARPELSLLGTAGRMINDGDRLCGLLDVPQGSETVRRAACFLNPVLHTAAMFRTEIVRERFGGYDERYRIAQDYDLWSRMLLAGEPCDNLPGRLVCYRHRADSLSKTGSEKAFAEAAEVAGRHTLEGFEGWLSAEESAALSEFREGRLPASGLGVFRHAVSQLGRGSPPGWGEFCCALEFRAAGALCGKAPLAAAGCVAAAFARKPGYAVRWLGGRFLG